MYNIKYKIVNGNVWSIRSTSYGTYTERIKRNKRLRG